jgi:hypothetical protein
VQTLNLGRAACGEILIFVWGRIPKGEILKNVGRAASESCSGSPSKCYLRIQSVPQREHHTSPLQGSVS